jgi:uncharacterized protein
VVLPGAFERSRRVRGVWRIPMLSQHDPAEPVGVWLELREDYRGPYARGQLIPEVARGRELLALLKAGTADGLSIGFRTVKGRLDPRTRVRKLDVIDLWEISIVTFPLLPGARVRAVKQASSPRSLPRGPAALSGSWGSCARARAGRSMLRCRASGRAARHLARPHTSGKGAGGAQRVNVSSP